MILEFVGALAAILAAAYLFTNAVEILGGTLKLGQGAVGSVLAAVGTALPETMIPIVAILGAALVGGDMSVAGEIGVGAILGAPFLLATLAMFVVGASAYGYRERRANGAEVRCRQERVDFPWCTVAAKDVTVDEETIARDMLFFLIFFAIAVAVGIVALPFVVKAAVAVVLFAAYAYYVRRALASGGELEEVPERLTLWRFASRPPTWAVAGQLVFALALMVVGAQVFVGAVELSSEAVGVPAGLVALVLAPLATELPEKLNSLIWVRDGKDTLALGNITGAMVFQSTIPVIFGLLFTPWVLGPINLYSAALALISGAIVYGALRTKGPLHAWQLMIGGLFYLAFLVGAVFATL